MIIDTVSDMQACATDWRRQGVTIGVVPTMGCLHAGHAALIVRARAECQRVVVTIFVNPTQFGPSEDFAAYPRPIDDDIAFCTKLGADAVFVPAPNEMYADTASTWVVEEKLSNGLCGETRPGHFRGVTTVVTKLFLAVLPDIAVFGQKDAQQALIIRRMIRDLNFPVRLIIEPIVREHDGLALSSRNRYLNAEQREQARALPKGLAEARQRYAAGERDAAVLCAGLRQSLESSGGCIDYIACVDVVTLKPVIAIESQVLLATAVQYGPARLIDNCLLPAEPGLSG